MTRSVYEAFKALTENQQIVLYYRNDDWTYADLGRLLGISLTRVIHIEHKAIRLLRRAVSKLADPDDGSLDGMPAPLTASQLVERLKEALKSKPKQKKAKEPLPPLVIADSSDLTAMLLKEADRLQSAGRKVEVILISDRDDAPDVAEYDKRGLRLGPYRLMKSRAIRDGKGLVLARTPTKPWTAFN